MLSAAAERLVGEQEIKKVAKCVAYSLMGTLMSQGLRRFND
jgi:hypothetical protein